ncbi:MAG: CD1375 family protein [Butyricicoccus sp.]
MRKLINNIRERFERMFLMMAMLFSQRVILGKCTFEQVPKKLQKQVAEILVEECGMPELVPAEYGGTKDVEAK